MDADDFLVDSFIDEFPMDVTSDALSGDYEEVLDAVSDGDAASNVHYLIQMPHGDNILSGVSQPQNVYNIVNTPTPIILTSSNLAAARPTYPVVQRVPGQPQQQQQVILQHVPVQQHQVQPQQVLQQPQIVRQQPVLQQQVVQQQQQQQQQMVKSQNDELEDEADEAVEDEEDEKPEEAEPVAKSVKQRKVRKKKDKNAPPPPLSAYAFFFRETQAKVKSQNPGAKFGDVSRSVAAMWEALSENEKTAYRTMSVDDHARFDAAMKAYRATQPATPQTGNAAAPKAKSVKVVFLGGKMLTTTTPAATPAEQPNQSNPIFQVGSTMMPLTTSVTPVKPEDITDNECIRTGCKNFAIKSPEWEDEYCSNDCAIRHCKDVFATFVANNLKV